MPLLRSVYSNPAEAAIHAFSTVSNVLERRELNQQRRELMAEEIADRRLRREREQERFGWERRKQEEWEKAVGRDNATRENIESLGHLLAADAENRAALEEGRDPVYTDKQREAIFNILGKSPLFDPDQVEEQTDSIRQIQTFMRQNGPALLKGGRLDRDKYPQLFESFDKVFQGQINRGTDRYGQSVEGNGVEKKVKSVFIDPKDKSLVFSLDVKTPVKEGQVFRHIGDRTPIYTVNPNAKGMVERGNIDLSKRPVVRRADGSVSTLSSMSFKDEDGKEVLIPMIGPDGEIMTVGEAVHFYRKTGKHLGKFETVEDANAYAEALHSDAMWNADIQAYSAKGQESTSYEAPLTFDRGPNPDAPVVKLPIAMFDGYLTSHLNLGSKIEQIRAQIDPKAYAEKIEKIKKQKEENKAISQAFAKVDTAASVPEQRRQFVSEFTKLMPGASVKETVDLAKTIIQEKEPRKLTKEDLALKAAEGDEEAKKALELLREGKEAKEPTEWGLRMRAEEGGPQAEPAKRALSRKEQFELKKAREREQERAKSQKGSQGNIIYDKEGRALRAIGTTAEEIKEKGEPVIRLNPQQVATQIERYKDMIFGYFSKDIFEDKEFDKPDIMRRKNVDELRNYIPDDRAELMGKFLDKIDEFNQGKKAREVFEATKNELEAGRSNLRQMTQRDFESVVKKFKDMPNGPEKRKAMEEYAASQGWDPAQKPKPE